MANTISSIEMYNLLREKIGDEQAKTLTNYVEQRIEQTFEKEKTHLATKQDLSEAKADIIKWMFLFWVGQITVTIGIVLLFIKK